MYVHVFSACTVTQRKIKMQTIQYRRTRIWEIKKDKYTKTLAKNQVCEIFQMRDIGKIYKALYGNAMLVSLSGTPIWPPDTNRNICFRVFLLMREFFA